MAAVCIYLGVTNLAFRSTQAPELAAGAHPPATFKQWCVRAANVNEQCVVEQHAVYFNDSIRTVHVTDTDQLNGCCIACGEYTRSVKSQQAGRATTEVERCNLWTWCATARGCVVPSGSHTAPCCQASFLLRAVLHGRAGCLSSFLTRLQELHWHCLPQVHCDTSSFTVQGSPNYACGWLKCMMALAAGATGRRCRTARCTAMWPTRRRGPTCGPGSACCSTCGRRSAASPTRRASTATGIAPGPTSTTGRVRRV